jgi:nucleotide-binding universal stress UspA family protein
MVKEQKGRYKMNKVLIAVDETKGSKKVFGVLQNLVKPPKEILLLHVQRLEGRSLMIDMLSESELSTIKESMEGTEFKEEQDRKTEKILNFYRKELENNGLISIRTIKKEGIPADEILKVAEEENVDLIVVGTNEKKWLNRLITGCVSENVERNSNIPVITGKAENMEKEQKIKEAVSPSLVKY